MSKDHSWNALLRQESHVDEAVRTGAPRTTANLEKTVILAAQAIVEAIWKARY